MLPRHHQDAAHRPAHLGDHRRGLERVVSDRAGKPQRARQLGGLQRSTTCTCDIWSCGMVKSSGVWRFRFLRGKRCHLARTARPNCSPLSAKRDSGSGLAHSNCAGTCVRCMRCVLMASSWFRRLREVVRARAGRTRAPGGRQAAWRGNCVRHRENRAGLRRRACRRIR